MGDVIALVSPFSRGLAWARTAFALSGLLTIMLTPASQLFFRSEGFPQGVVCSNSLSRASLFCMLPGDRLWLAESVACGILVAVVAGVAPCITGVLHWWVAWSLNSSSPIPDGGDQVVAVMTFFLIPMLLVDQRASHWTTDRTYVRRSWMIKSLAHASLVICWIQVSVIYFNAAVAKFGVAEWADGTVLWYWIQDPSFTPPGFVDRLLTWLMASFGSTVALGYGVLLLELLLASALVMAAKWRKLIFGFGLLFHSAIGMTFGLWSFFLAMAGALGIYLLRPHDREASRSDSPTERTSWSD
jgi:antimicrobial peptide system SdpB family protein